jgi:hypothetical protein
MSRAELSGFIAIGIVLALCLALLGMWVIVARFNIALDWFDPEEDYVLIVTPFAIALMLAGSVPIITIPLRRSVQSFGGLVWFVMGIVILSLLVFALLIASLESGIEAVIGAAVFEAICIIIPYQLVLRDRQEFHTMKPWSLLGLIQIGNLGGLALACLGVFLVSLVDGWLSHYPRF